MHLTLQRPAVALAGKQVNAIFGISEQAGLSTARCHAYAASAVLSLTQHSLLPGVLADLVQSFHRLSLLLQR